MTNQTLLDNQTFDTVHIIGIVSCTISVIASASILVYLFCYEARTNTKKKFYRWTTGERLVVYLAIFDLCFSSSHGIDHTYIYFTRKIPGLVLCHLFAFIVKSFVLGQWLTVLFIAVNAFVLTVFHIKLDFGRFDWKLLVSVVGIPITFCTFGIIFNYLGPRKAW